jgi:hypothetical protein
MGKWHTSHALFRPLAAVFYDFLIFPLPFSRFTGKIK